MNHIFVRRLALLGASFSFASLFALTLLCGVVYSAGMGEYDLIGEQSAGSNPYSSMKEDCVSDTKIMIKNLASYDGAFYEDGSGREVFGVAAVMVFNDTDELISFAHIVVITQEDYYIFDATMIPPKASVLIPEKYAKKLNSSVMVDHFIWHRVDEQIKKNTLCVEETAEGELTVDNLSDHDVSDAVIYHRTYIREGDYYVGGEVFETEIPPVQPGEKIKIYPQYYASGYSKIVWIE